jgi:hypothetical protein
MFVVVVVAAVVPLRPWRVFYRFVTTQWPTGGQPRDQQKNLQLLAGQTHHFGDVV